MHCEQKKKQINWQKYSDIRTFYTCIVDIRLNTILTATRAIATRLVKSCIYRIYKMLVQYTNKYTYFTISL